MEPKPRHAAHAARPSSQDPGDPSKAEEPRDFIETPGSQGSPDGTELQDLQDDLGGWEAPVFQETPVQGAYMRPVNTRDVRRAGSRPKSRKKAAASNGSSAVRSAKAHRRRRNPFGVAFRFLASLLAIAALCVVVGGGALAIT